MLGVGCGFSIHFLVFFFVTKEIKLFFLRLILTFQKLKNEFEQQPHHCLHSAADYNCGSILAVCEVREVSQTLILKNPTTKSSIILCTRYDPELAQKNVESVKQGAKQIKDVYPSNKIMRNIRILTTIKPFLSVPRRPCDDLHWFWFPDDFPEEVRLVRRLPQHDLLRPCNRGLHPSLRLLPPPL